MPYSNQVFAGKNLIIPAIQSPNYVADVSGWSINRDGTIEVNSGIFRGRLVVGAPPGAGATINSAVPAVLTTYYGNSGVTLSSVAILLYPGDSSYHYEIIGTDALGNELWGNGWVNTTSTVFEYEQQRLNVTSANLLQYAFGNGTTLPGNRTQWSFGNSLGASKTGLPNIFSITDTNINLGITGDIGGLDVKLTSVFEKTVRVIGVVTADTDVNIGGILTAANRVIGNDSITPSAANTPTSKVITFPATLTGTTFTCVVTPNTSGPGTAVTGVSFTNLSSTGVTIWLTRVNTVTTGFSYVVEGH